MSLIAGIKNNTLREINQPGGFIQASIDLKDISGIAEALATNRSVTRINLSGNYIGDTEAELLAVALKTNFSVTHINLSNNRITSKGIKSLADVLKLSHSITYIDLSHNCFGNSGAKALAFALEHNCSVSYMDIAYNQIGQKGLVHLAKSLKSNQILTTIYYYRIFSFSVINLNVINEKGINATIEALKENHSLTHYDVVNFDNDIFERLFNHLIKSNCLSRHDCHKAAQEGDLEKVQEQLDKGVSLLSVTGEDENTLLHWAVLRNHIEIVAFLIRQFQAKKITVSVENKRGKTPLELATELRYSEIIKLLFDAKNWFVAFSTQSLLMNHAQSLQTTEQRAITHAQSERMQQWEAALSLLKNKRREHRKLEEDCCDLEQKLLETPKDTEKYIEIHEECKAAKRKLEESNQALSEAVENSRQLTSQLNASKKNLEVLEDEKKRLLARLEEINHHQEYIRHDLWVPLYAAVDNEDEKIIRRVLDQGYKINSLADGITVLHRAVDAGSQNIIKLLLEKNANPNTKGNFRSETPFHRAVRSLDLSIIELLIQAGADVTIPMEVNERRIKAWEFVKELEMIPLEVKIDAMGQRETTNNGLSDQDREERAKNIEKLQKCKKICSLLKETNRQQDIDETLKRAKKLIDKKQLDLEIMYGTAIDTQLRRPEILASQNSDIFSAYIENMGNEHKDTKSILDSIQLLPQKKKELEKNIEEFFKHWRLKLKEADEIAKNKYSKNPQTSNSPSSQLSSGSSYSSPSMEG